MRNSQLKTDNGEAGGLDAACPSRCGHLIHANPFAIFAPFAVRSLGPERCSTAKGAKIAKKRNIQEGRLGWIRAVDSGENGWAVSRNKDVRTWKRIMRNSVVWQRYQGSMSDGSQADPAQHHLSDATRALFRGSGPRLLADVRERPPRRLDRPSLMALWPRPMSFSIARVTCVWSCECRS